MNTTKTPRRRHFLIAAFIGLAPVTLALWLTYTGNGAQAGREAQRTDLPEDKASDTMKASPQRKNTESSGTS
jgi:hypothetical protein